MVASALNRLLSVIVLGVVIDGVKGAPLNGEPLGDFRRARRSQSQKAHIRIIIVDVRFVGETIEQPLRPCVVGALS